MSDKENAMKKRLQKELKELEKAKAKFVEMTKQLTESRNQLALDRQAFTAQWAQLQAQLQVQQSSGGSSRGTQGHVQPGLVTTQPYVQQIVTTIGELKEFNIQEDWTLWKERLDQFFFANDIPENKKVSILITLLGSEGYALLRNLCAPFVPSAKSFEQLTEIMTNHLQPKPSIITERFKFKECRQKMDEDIKTFSTNLKRLSTYCEFGDNLDNHLRDQFVWGLRNASIQKRLLREEDLSYVRAVELAHSLESVSRDVAEIGAAQENQKSINFMGSKGLLLYSEHNAMNTNSTTRFRKPRGQNAILDIIDPSTGKIISNEIYKDNKIIQSGESSNRETPQPQNNGVEVIADFAARVKALTEGFDTVSMSASKTVPNTNNGAMSLSNIQTNSVNNANSQCSSNPPMIIKNIAGVGAGKTVPTISNQSLDTINYYDE